MQHIYSVYKHTLTSGTVLKPSQCVLLTLIGPFPLEAAETNKGGEKKIHVYNCRRSTTHQGRKRTTSSHRKPTKHSAKLPVPLPGRKHNKSKTYTKLKGVIEWCAPWSLVKLLFQPLQTPQQLTLFPDVFQDRDYSQTFQHIHTYLLHWENHFFTSKFVCLATKLHIQPFISWLTADPTAVIHMKRGYPGNCYSFSS